MNYEQRLNDNQRKRFAFMLKQKRKDKKLSQDELGDILGYSQASIQRWKLAR